MSGRIEWEGESDGEGELLSGGWMITPGVGSHGVCIYANISSFGRPQEMTKKINSLKWQKGFAILAVVACKVRGFCS